MQLQEPESTLLIFLSIPQHLRPTTLFLPFFHLHMMLITQKYSYGFVRQYVLWRVLSNLMQVVVGLINSKCVAEECQEPPFHPQPSFRYGIYIIPIYSKLWCSMSHNKLTCMHTTHLNQTPVLCIELVS